MSKHLSSEQIAQWTLGDFDDEVDQHLSNCYNCRSEAALFKLALSSFRESARDWADEHMRPHDETVRRIRLVPYRSVLNQVSLVAVAGLVCLLVALGVQHQTTANVAPIAVNDTLLLQSVRQDLSDNVPTALAPIEALVSPETSTRATMR